MQSTDLLIIGGGVNGCGIAADAAGRGLNVVLCEQNDLASATSSASSKLIHGGLRYLEQGDFRLVRKALLEREKLLNIAPHLIQPLRFIIPHNKLMRSGLIVRLGLFIYGCLGGKSQLPRPRQLKLQQDSVGIPLKGHCTKGFSYYDCSADDSRLVIANALAAAEHSAQILTRTRFLTAKRQREYWQVTLQTASGETVEYQARALINAAGPWVKQLQPHIDNSPATSLRLVKGSHIIVPQLYRGDHAYLLQNTDKRIVFVMPYQQQFSLIGTTEEDYQGNPSEAQISMEEKQYLCECVNRYFSKSLTPEQIISDYSGVRPLIHEPETSATAVTRDYQIELNVSAAAKPAAPLVTIFGGKITTYRLLAEQVLSLLKPHFPKTTPAWTAQTPLPGGDLTTKNFQQFIEQLHHHYPWLDQHLLERYARGYGSRTYLLLQNCHSLTDLGHYFAASLYQREVEYLIQHEWAINCEDILWRRTKLGLLFDAPQVETLERWMSESIQKAVKPPDTM